MGKLYFLSMLMLLNVSYSQPPSVEAREVINLYLEAIGGKDHWKNLESRKAQENVTLYTSTGLMEIEDQVLDYTKYFQVPNNYLDLWFKAMHFTIFVQTSNCTWYYLDKNVSVLFMDKKYRKQKAKFPRIGVLEILNFPIAGDAVVEKDSYRIDFEDRPWKRLISIYFDKENFLITQHAYTNPGGDRHEYFYKDYREKDGYLEPYIIENYVESRKYKVTTIKSIQYNLEVDPAIFTPPVECISKSENVTVPLEERIPFIF